MRIESGTCNVCSAPCSSCMHHNRSMSAIGSKNESGFSSIICARGEEADSSSVINLGDLTICKSKICKDLQLVTSETSNLISTTSSHDSYFENADSKAVFRASAVYDASDDADMPQDVSSCEFGEQVRSLERKQRFSSEQGEEQSELECHGDNILYTSEGRDANVSGSDFIVDVEKKDLECSNMIINCTFNVNPEAIPNEGGRGKIGRKLNVTGNASSLDDICNSISVNDVSTAKSQLPLPDCDVSPEENIRCVEGDSVKASIASLAARFSEQKSSTLPDHEVSTPTRINSEFSSGISKIDEPFQETRTVTDLQNSFNGGSKGSSVKVPLERNGTILDSTNGQGHHVQTQAITEGENSDSDVMLDDVKVCDICGDAGREDLLAICSRCSDGAEHTYCMSQMLLKIPEGEWLCEECKIKEKKNQNADECETVSESLNSNYLNEGNKKALSTSFTKKLPKLDIGPTDLVTKRPYRGLQSSHNLTPRQSDHPEEGKSSERNGTSMETASPRKKPTLSHQISLKNQVMEKVNLTILPTLTEVQSTKFSEAFSRSKVPLSSSSFKGQPHPHSPHGLLSRSVSFSYSNNVPKVKTLIENAPHKQKITRESTNIDLRKEVSVKTLTRNTSFGNATSRLHTESVSKSSSFKPSHIEGLRGPKESKERSVDGRNNISAMQNSIFRPSAVISSNHPTKVDAKHVHGDGKIKNISETDFHCLNKGFSDANDLGSNEEKKQALYSSKILGYSDGNSKFEHLKKPTPLNKGILSSTSAIDGSNRKVELVSPHSVVQSSEYGRKDESLRDSPSSSGSRPSSLVGSQKLRCKKCNETGHVIQHCSNNKLQKATNNLEADGNSNEVVKKKNKWRDIVDAAISRRVLLKGNKADASEVLPPAKIDLNCAAASKNAPNAFIQRNSVSITLKDSNIDSTKNIASSNSVQSAVLPVEVSHVSKADDPSHCLPSDKLSAKPFVDSLQGLAPFLENTIRSSAIPKLECIWQGSFNVLGIGNCPENFDGIQAHLSSCASHRVFEAAIKIPGSVDLEEVSHFSLWPHFQRIGPQEENIALFFFAKDAESYDRSYGRLMDRLHKNDLALRGSIDGFEILIFTSNKLPMKSQRWNMIYYLWGMFRARREHGLPLICGQRKRSMPNLDLELPNQDLSIPPINIVCNAQDSGTSLNLNNLSECRSSKITPGKPAGSLHVLPISSGNEDKACRRLESSVQNSSSQVVADPNVPQGKHPFPVEKSSGITADLLAVTNSPKSMRLMSASNSFSEEQKDRTFPKMLVSDCTNSNTVDFSTFPNNIGEESNLRRASSVPLISLNCNQGDDFRRIERNLRDSVCSTSNVAIMDVVDPTTNVLGVERLNNKKRGRSLLSSGDEREPKKNCFTTDIVSETNVSNRLSSKIHPLYSAILSPQIEGEQIYCEPVPLESSRTRERCFFPTDLYPVQNNKSANIIHIPSSDDEAIPESCSPDLELALGGNSKLAKPMASPLPFKSVGIKQPIQLGSSGCDGDDLSSSLSLSLAFPAAEREGSAKCILEKEPILHEKPSANTSLFLFGRFNNP